MVNIRLKARRDVRVSIKYIDDLDFSQKIILGNDQVINGYIWT